MQNRYAGDAGDFGKIGLLRVLAKSGLKIGVNWYLVPDEIHNDDGKHIGYLSDSRFVSCDDELLGKLGYMVYSNQRGILMLERMDLIPNATYFNEELLNPQMGGAGFRNQWHKNALNRLRNSDIVFLDPDNGLLVKSVTLNSRKSNKYVSNDEIIDYYSDGHSIVFYNHRSRQEEQSYLKRFSSFFSCEGLCGAEVIGIKFVRGTIRDYLFLLHPEHVIDVSDSIKFILNSNWSQHFKALQFQYNR